MDLLSWFQSLLASGAANGWQSFGQGSAWNSRELGQDVGVPIGTPVPGIAGTVVAIQHWLGNDYAVSIQDASGNVYTVGHVTPNSALQVGQQVSDGQQIGVSGGAASSISSGPHIELQVQPASPPSGWPLLPGGYVNPVSWVNDLVGMPGWVKDPTVPGQTGKGLPQVSPASKWTATATAAPAPSGLQAAFHLAQVAGTPSTWWRLLFILAGAGMILTGIILLFRRQATQIAVIAAMA